MRFLILLLALGSFCHAQRKPVPATRYNNWGAYHGGPENLHYTTLGQITPANVAKLKAAWTLETGDAFEGSEIQCNPIVLDGILYATSPKLRVMAIDGATGKQLWSFDPYEGRPVRNKQRNRGLMHWTDGKQSRLYVAAQYKLYSLDLKTGKPDAAFGGQGWIDLRDDLGRPKESHTVGLTTPGVVFEDLLIIGSICSEGLPAAPGDIRAYDARTGKLRWAFHTIPHPGEFGYESWPKEGWKTLGGANNWPGMALDVKRGLVFAPTGSAAYDFFGANRPGNNLFANTLLCLNARTGKRVWHFQAVRHDVWDRDFPTNPVLVTVARNGKLIDAVAQATKSGHVFVFNRETGESLFPLEEKPAPASPVAEEKLASAQVLPLRPEPFARQRLTEDMLTTRTPEANRIARERLKTVRSNGQWEPPSLEGTIVFPGFDGAAEWGGQAFDPETGLFYVNSNEMAWILRLVPRAKATAATNGRRIYVRSCAGCHRDDLGGSPPEFPSLRGLGAKTDAASLDKILRGGVGRMPGFAHLGTASIDALKAYLLTGEEKEVVVAPATSVFEQAYSMDGYNKFLDPDGYPAIAPPWGTLNAISLDSGNYAWKIPFGEHPELVAKGMKDTGSENYGGPLVTKSGLLFIGASNFDKKFRAYDKKTGKLLWETLLPFSGNATPATYMVNGKQYVVIAAGGGKSGAASGGAYVAFALP
ncbi:MAG: PQQ-binding-like beta-propeller repeat protein [Bryobacterales bacterium]|nr:PQQ-binding-like beta-propeller repeat protein [Bryobacterales bacterium]